MQDNKVQILSRVITHNSVIHHNNYKNFPLVKLVMIVRCLKKCLSNITYIHQGTFSIFSLTLYERNATFSRLAPLEKPWRIILWGITIVFIEDNSQNFKESFCLNLHALYEAKYSRVD